MAGEIEKTEDGVLVIRRIHVRYELQVEPDADRDKIDRVHGLHADRCPVARSIREAIGISTELEVVDGT